MQEQVPARVIEVEPGVVGRFAPMLDGQQFAVETTLPQDTQADRARILAIIEGESTKAQDVIGSEFFLGDYIMHPIELENPDTGEAVDAIRALLLQPNGNPIAFVSVGVLKSIARIAWKERRNPPFDPPVLVRLVQRGTGKGRRTYKLVPVE